MTGIMFSSIRRMIILLTARFNVGGHLKKTDTSNGPKSAEEFTEGWKPVMHDGIRKWEKGKFEPMEREW